MGRIAKMRPLLFGIASSQSAHPADDSTRVATQKTFLESDARAREPDQPLRFLTSFDFPAVSPEVLT